MVAECLDRLLLICLKPAVKIVAIQVNAASLTHHHDFPPMDEMLERLLRPSYVRSRVFHREQS